MLGAVATAGISDMLVRVLTGVFYPPPDVLSSCGATPPR